MADLVEEVVGDETVSAEAAAAPEKDAPVEGAAAPLAPKRPRKPKMTAEEKAAAEAAKAAAKAEKAAAKASASRTTSQIKAGALIYNMTDVITLLVTENPKSGASAERFAGYVSGQTVKEALAAGLKRADIVWDVGHGFIRVDPVVVAEAEPEAA